MKIKYGQLDITSYILNYKRKGSIGEDNIFLLGNTPSYEVDIRIDNTDGCMIGQHVITIYDDNDILKGTYLIYNAPQRYTKQLTLTCFDYMICSNIAYQSKLQYPAIIKEQLEEIAYLTDLSINYENLPEIVLKQEVNHWDSTISCRTYIGWIAEIAGMNAYANELGVICFKPISSTADWRCEAIGDYEKGEPFKVTRICYDNGLLKLEKGDQSGNTLYLSANNPYIDSRFDPVDRLYSMYANLTFHSLHKMKAGGLDDLQLFDTFDFQNIRYLCLDVVSTYGGGNYQIQELSGSLLSQSADKVTSKFNDSIRIKKLEVILDENEQKLAIIAKNQEETETKLSTLSIDVDSIHQEVSSSTEIIEYMNKVERLQCNITASKQYLRKIGEEIRLQANILEWGNDITEQLSETCFNWYRHSKDSDSDQTWNMSCGIAKKELTITNHDVLGQCNFECSVNWEEVEKVISKKESEIT